MCELACSEREHGSWENNELFESQHGMIGVISLPEVKTEVVLPMLSFQSATY